jgi:hypothetical protein
MSNNLKLLIITKTDITKNKPENFHGRRCGFFNHNLFYIPGSIWQIWCCHADRIPNSVLIA